MSKNQQNFDENKEFSIAERGMQDIKTEHVLWCGVNSEYTNHQREGRGCTWPTYLFWSTFQASQWDRALEKLVHMDAEPAAQAPNVSKTKPRLCIVIPVFQCILPLDHCWNPNFWPWLLHSMAIELNLCLLAVCWTNLWRSEWIPYSLDHQTPLAFSRELLWHS